MLTRPASSTDDLGFVRAHRLVAEVAAGRPVVLTGEDGAVLAAPLDGGPVLSDRLAISGARAAWLGLAEAPTLIAAGTTDPAALLALATAPVATVGAGAAGGPVATAAVELAKLAERVPAMTLGDAAAAPDGTLAAAVADVLTYRARLATSYAPVAAARVPLAAGATAQVTAFRNAVGGVVSAVAVGLPHDGTLVRVHSQCVTGDIFGSTKCDCGAQLDLAMRRIAADGGVLVYTSQEGRGIGLVNKLRAYALQDGGLDTVDANAALGFHDDERDYVAAASILSQLGLSSIRLLTNNPSKAAGLEAYGLRVAPVPLVGPVTPENASYLATKRRRSGHRL